MSYEIKIVFWGLVLPLAIAFLAVAGSYFLVSRPACIELSKLTGREAFISPRVSCMLKDNGEWVDYRVVTEKKSSVTIKRESAK